mmetsp:Transcript_18803/g.38500  ORF Transcript_18803/g.38500 Transcript_18803/m.38500 type:complete len:126 (-) Transcript_18803:80-457(-)
MPKQTPTFHHPSTAAGRRPSILQETLKARSRLASLDPQDKYVFREAGALSKLTMKLEKDYSSKRFIISDDVADLIGKPSVSPAPSRSSKAKRLAKRGPQGMRKRTISSGRARGRTRTSSSAVEGT